MFNADKSTFIKIDSVFSLINSCSGTVIKYASKHKIVIKAAWYPLIKRYKWGRIPNLKSNYQNNYK